MLPVLIVESYADIVNILCVLPLGNPAKPFYIRAMCHEIFSGLKFCGYLY